MFFLLPLPRGAPRRPLTRPTYGSIHMDMQLMSKPMPLTSTPIASSELTSRIASSELTCRIALSELD
jgi:hypothetical protein